MQQSIGKFPFADCSSAARHWGIALFGFCAKLIEDFDCEVLFCFKLLRGYDSEPSYILNTPTRLIWLFRLIIYLKYGPLMWRFPFIKHLKHAPSFGGSGSSSILNMPTSLDDCDSTYILNSRSSYMLRTPPSLGDSGS